MLSRVFTPGIRTANRRIRSASLLRVPNALRATQ
jgi:hypothetical protein